MKRTKSPGARSLLLFSVALCLCFCFCGLFAVGMSGARAGVQRAAQLDITDKFVKNDVDETTENGETVYTFKDTGLKYLNSDLGGTDIGGYNTVSFDVKWNDEQLYSDDGRNISLWIDRTLNGTSHWVEFKCNPLDAGEKGIAAILTDKSLNYAGSVFINWTAYTQETVKTDEWHNFSIAFEAKDGVTYCKFLYDGTEIASFTDGSGGYSLNGFMFTSYGLKSSMKGIKLGYTPCAPAEPPMFAGGVKSTELENGKPVDIYTLDRNPAGINLMKYTGDTENVNTVSFDISMSEFGDGCMADLFVCSKEYPDDTEHALRLDFQPHWAYAAFRGSIIGWLDERGTVNYVENLDTERFDSPANPSYGWLHVTCSFMRGYACYKITYATSGGEQREYSGEAVLPDAYGYGGTTIYLRTYYMAAKIKNFTCENTVIDIEKEWLGVECTDGVYNFPRALDPVALSHVGATGTDGSGNFNNTVTFDIRPNTYAADDHTDENAGLIVYADKRDGSYLFAELLPHNNTFRLRIIKDNNRTLLGMGRYEGEKTDYLHVKITFAENFVAAFVSNESEKADGDYAYTLAASAFDTRGYSFEDVGCAVSAWKSSPSVKNIKIGYEALDYVAAGYADLDFTDARSVAVISASATHVFEYNASLKTVDFTAKTNAPEVTLALGQPAGSRWAAYVPVRNTVMLRLKNGTSAEQLKLAFKTDASETSYEKAFDITADDECKTYYFNISDKGANGYLQELAFTLVGARENEKFSVEAVSFEREDDIYAWAAVGDISCTADKDDNLVTVTGAVKTAYASKKVHIVESLAENYLEKLDGADLGSAAVAQDGSFTVTFPYSKGYKQMTHLGSFFLAYVEDGAEKIKLSHAFKIANYAELAGLSDKDNTDISGGEYTVTDAVYGAKGDGYNDDTPAIQKAIDAASAAGGGKVVVPGDKSEYGRRYVVTNIVLKNNVELCIQKGAVLWQSSRISDYPYTPALGHDAPDTTAMWAHNCWVSNYPLIQITDCHNVKLSGGGMIRMSDTGNEWTDAGDCWTTDDDGHSMLVGCADRIHLTPIGISNSYDVTVADIEIRRASEYQVVVRISHDVLIQNVNNKEAVCQNTDGFSIQNSHHVTLLCNSNHSNDDSFVLLSYLWDARDKEDWWLKNDPNMTSVHDILLVGNAVYGGLGLAFIPWGSGHEDLSKVETYNIVAYDNVFSGGQSVGCWPDNPNYGYRKFTAYNVYYNAEYGDSSPIRNVWLHDNRYPQFAGLEFKPSENKIVADATGIISDVGINGASNFVNASFEREYVEDGVGYVRYVGEKDFVSGLAYWSSDLGEGGAVGTEETGEVKSKPVRFTDTGERYEGDPLEVKDYAGYLSGNAKLYQGLYLKKGYYEFTVKIRSAASSAKIFAAEARYGEVGTIINSRSLDASDVFTVRTLGFRIERDGVYAIGVMNESGSTEKVYIDDASIAPALDPDKYTVDGDEYEYGFDEDACGFVLPESGVSVTEGKLVADGDGENIAMLDQRGNISEFDVSVEIAASEEKALAAGLVFMSGDKGYAVMIEKTAGSTAAAVRIYEYKNGAFTQSTYDDFDFALSGDKAVLRLVRKGLHSYLFLNGAEAPLKEYKLLALRGNIGLRTSGVGASFDNLRLVTSLYLDRENAKALAALVFAAKEYDGNEYTEESFAELTEAIRAAEALASDAPEADYIAAQERLRAAIDGLTTRPIDPPTPPPADAGESEDETNIGLIVGLSVGGAVLLGAAVAIVMILRKRKNKAK